MSNSDRLTGPDFLDSVADQSAAQGLPVNAAEFRQRATDWRADHARIEQLEADLARLERQLRSDTERARIKATLTAAQQQAVATPLPGDKGSVQALFNPTLQPMQQGGGEVTPPSAPVGVEAKTLPVPTRVHLIGETAVIVGTPERGWDEDAQDAHNCDAMGCATIGPHVLARVPFTDERALAATQKQGQAVAWQDEWRAAVAAKLSGYGLSEEASAVFAESELGEYRAGLCDCAENDPADMVDLMMGVALDAIEKWKAESAGRPFGYKRTALPSAPVGVEGFEQWYARVDARFWNNWDACNAAFHAGKRSALAQQPAAVDEALDRLRRENVPCLWHADLVGGRISEERMRVILTAALAANDTLAAPPAAATR